MNIKFPKIAPEGNIFIIIFAVVTLLFLLFSPILGIIGIILTVWCIAFFRDPDRQTPLDDSLVIAPADGKIIKIEKVIPPEDMEISEQMTKISIFMNVFNVHINRTPCTGKIEKIIYSPGKFINASFDKASIHNERQSFIMSTKSNHKVAFVQIAGLVARRIVKFIEEDTDVQLGEKIGLIRFGSRLDIYLPEDISPLVTEGQTTIGGETILAQFGNTEETLNYTIQDRANKKG